MSSCYDLKKLKTVARQHLISWVRRPSLSHHSRRADVHDLRSRPESITTVHRDL